MQGYLRIADRLERIPQIFGKLGAWLILPLIGIIMFDVITRKFQFMQQWIMSTVLYDFMSPTKLQELEWHLHAALFLLALGYAYTVNAHVRVDLLREKLSDRGQAWVELIGILCLMLPYVLVVLYYGWTFVHQAWESNESSDAMTGLSHRWVIKSFVLLGLALTLMAGVATLLRQLVYLFGPEDLRGTVKMNMLTSAVAEHLPKIQDSGEPGDLPPGVVAERGAGW
ncbi:MAG: TRAP transporter small permease subunit [Thalassobaculum sp.]|uniref:TRAP transporter small permease subunit n=1 Tax=Thalassobaculum sp. TaxID=2022740 RepID=UPI0032EA9283